MTPETTREIRITAVNNGAIEERQDSVATEEPLEIRLILYGSDPRSLAITMRTPGNDDELALGFLWSEGILTDPEDIGMMLSHGPLQPSGHRNRIDIGLSEASAPALDIAARNFYMTSSCGICGKASIDAVDQARPFVLKPGTPRFSISRITGLSDTLRASQETFSRTGGLHAAGLFDSQGKLHIVREDVGRHNAVDKVVGAAILGSLLPLSDSLLMVSGRASFELVQKAAMAGIPVLAAVGAPSSLAVSLARDAGLTLIGFMRGDRFNIYAGRDRIVLEETRS